MTSRSLVAKVRHTVLYGAPQVPARQLKLKLTTNSPDAIFRTERGRMRNQWFPAKKAEYMTASRFQELGLTRRDIGDRDATYGTLEAAEVEVIPEPEVPITTVVTASVCVPHCPCYPPLYPAPCGANDAEQQPEKSHTFLTTRIPGTLTFHRKPIPAPAPPPPTQSISPLVAAANPDTAHDRNAPLAIYGSVSATDVVAYIKGLLLGDAEGSRMVLGPENIRFLGLAEEADRVKTLGRWEVEISVGNKLEPVRKVVEILPSAEGADEGEA
jgi:hypothetical protein